MKYRIPNTAENKWLTLYNKLITKNEDNKKTTDTPKRFRIVPSVINDGIETGDADNYVWLSKRDAFLAKKYLWKYNSYFALPLWFAIVGDKNLKVNLTDKEFTKLRKDTLAVKSKKLAYTTTKKAHNIYLANGLFCAGDRLFNDLICEKLSREDTWNVYAPQKNLAINDKKKSAPSSPIYEGDTEELKKADVIIAVLDGQDLGVATEVGWVAGWNEVSSEKKTIVGIFTDNRDASKTASSEKNEDMVKCGIAESQYPYVNLYTIGAIKKCGTIVSNIDETIEYIQNLK